ncbi:MAG: hypothetical protein KY463_08055, partial [Actinobacteria bacterium]|nr:hypothetical protein [Actinomycetota bacterium]
MSTLGASRIARAVVIGAGARRALREGAEGVVELAFGAVGYARVGEHRVLLAPARSPIGPLSILVSGLMRGDLAPGQPVRVAGEQLVVGGLRIELAGARGARPLRAEPLALRWPAALAA